MGGMTVLQPKVINEDTAQVEIIPGVLRIYGNDAYPVSYRRLRSIDAPRARYTGFKPETVTLRAGTIRRHGAKPLPCDIVFERDVPVTLRDGTTIYTDVFRPTGETKVPSIVAWSPYGKQFGGAWLDDFPRRFDVPLGAVSELQKWEGPDPAYWVAQGYAILNPDSRGAYDSKGNVTFFGRQLAEDGYDFVEWAAGQPWSSGKVAMSGNSWLAISQWFIAAENPPHLTAIAPWEGFTDQFRSMTNRGGIPAPGFTEAIISTTMAGRNYVEDVARMSLSQQTINKYWQDKIARPDRIQIPTYVVASYTSPIHTHGSFQGFRSIASRDKWLRVHNTFEWPDYYDAENLEDLRKFFDYYLKGEKNDWPQTPRVRIAVLDPGHQDSVNRAVPDWPVPGYATQRLHLHANGSLSKEKPVENTTVFYECEDGALTFTHNFTEDVEIVGYMNLVLSVSANGSSDMDLSVSVEKRDKDGHPFTLPDVGSTPKLNPATGFLRVSHRALDRRLSMELEPFHRHDREELLVHGQIVPVEIGLWPAALRFHPGEQLAVTIQAAPMVDPTVDRGPYGVRPVRVPVERITFTPGEEVLLVELGGPVDSQPEFVDEERVRVPDSRNKGTHVIHLGSEYETTLLVPWRAC